LLSLFQDNGHLTRAQIRYNEKHTRTRQPIGRAFGSLKDRWQRLKYIDIENVQEVPSVISAACVLHNFCLIADEGSIKEFFDLDDNGMIMVMTNLNSIFQFPEQQQLPREIKWSSFLTTYSFFFSQINNFLETVNLLLD